MQQLDDKVWEKIYKLRDNFILETKNRFFYNYQKRFSNRLIKSVIMNEGKTIAAEFSRQSGKTTSVTETVVFLMLFYFQICKKFRLPHTPFFNVGFFAPQDQQARTDFMLVRDFLKECSVMGFDYTFSEFNADTIHMKSKIYQPRMDYSFTASPTSHP